ncbi:MAG: hypothetical protein JWP97_803 [Labilithrix sp.]|nr:hypothetical protein [Labilithrix sp.]
MRLLGLLLVAALAAPACSPAQVDVHTRVAVTITPRPDRMPFDPRSARLASATEQLRAAAGHHVALDVDAAMVPELRSSFEEALGRSFEAMTRDLTRLRKDPEAFAYAAARLERVSLRYDATLRGDVVTFDVAHRTVEVRGPARRDDLVSEGTLVQPMLLAYADDLRARYEGKRASDVPAAERGPYVRVLLGDLPGRRRGRDVPAESPSALANAPEASRILTALELSRMPGTDAATLHRLDAWLLDQKDWFADQYQRHAALVRQLPAQCTFHAAETAYATWLLARFRAPGTTDEQRLAIARRIFVPSYGDEREQQGGRTYAPFAWPGIDRFAFGMSVIDEWRRDGHPTQLTPRRSTQTEEFIVCPRAAAPGGRGGNLAPRCEHDFYRFADETEGGTKKLAAALLERNDPVLTATVFAALRPRGSETDARLALLRAVEGGAAAVWRAGARDLGERVDNSSDRAVLEEAQRLWLQAPAYRGTVLLLLGHVDRYGHGNVPWRDFGEAFGSRTTRAELDAYLDEGSLAMMLLPIVWPSLDRGYSRAAAILPRLDAFLGDPEYNRSNTNNGTHRALREIISELCAERNVADLAALHEYLVNRVASHPGESYGDIAEEATSRRCNPAPPPPPPRNEVRLVPGKKRLRIIQSGAEPADRFL